MTSIPLAAMEGGASAKFTNMGDSHAGKIIDIAQRQSTDIKTGQLSYFPSGDPIMMWVITIEKDNGDITALFARGGNYKPAKGSGQSMLSAIGAAVRTADADAVDVGGRIAVAYTGETEPQPGKNPAKLYTAQYEPPAPETKSVPVDLFDQ